MIVIRILLNVNIEKLIQCKNDLCEAAYKNGEEGTCASLAIRTEGAISRYEKDDRAHSVWIF